MGNVRRFSEILHLPKINDCRIRNLITVQEIKSLRRHVRHSVQSYSTQWKHNLQYTPMPADKFSNAENRNLPARNSKLSVPKNKKASQHKRKHLLKTSRSTPAPPLIRNNAVFPFGKILTRLSEWTIIHQKLSGWITGLRRYLSINKLSMDVFSGTADIGEWLIPAENRMASGRQADVRFLRQSPHG